MGRLDGSFDASENRDRFLFCCYTRLRCEPCMLAGWLAVQTSQETERRRFSRRLGRRVVTASSDGVSFCAGCRWMSPSNTASAGRAVSAPLPRTNYCCRPIPRFGLRGLGCWSSCLFFIRRRSTGGGESVGRFTIGE
ncbi:unnamed protein product [Ectocarpus fasciculatus]